jgi:hypothetical protein
MRRRHFSKQPEYADIQSLQVRHSRWDAYLNLRTRSHLTPEVKPSANQFRAFADARQSPMPATCTFLEHLWVNTNSIISNSQAKGPMVISNLYLDLFGARMPKSVPEDLSSNPIDLVLKSRR